MSRVTYYVALPFVNADGGLATGEPVECFNPTAVVMRAEALSRKSSAPATFFRVSSARAALRGVQHDLVPLFDQEIGGHLSETVG
jgi:hypothetical protein